MAQIKAKGGDVPLPVDVVCREGAVRDAPRDHQGRSADRSGRSDPGHRAEDRRAPHRAAEAGRHHRLERAGRACSSTISSPAGTRAIAQAIASSSAFLAGRRRRDRRRLGQVRRHRQDRLCIHRGRRFPRVPRGQEAARRSRSSSSGPRARQSSRLLPLPSTGPDAAKHEDRSHPRPGQQRARRAHAHDRRRRGRGADEFLARHSARITSSAPSWCARCRASSSAPSASWWICKARRSASASSRAARSGSRRATRSSSTRTAGSATRSA